jgi:cytochrome P450
VLIIYIYFFLI